MAARAVPLPDLAPSDEEAWRDLAARSIEPNPFYEADLLLPASRYLKNGKGVMLLVAEDESGRFQACLPVHRACMAGPLSPPVVTSWRHLHSCLGTPLVAPERASEALRCLLAALRGTGIWRRVVVFELFGDDGPVASYLRLAAEELGLAVYAHAPGERAVFWCQDERDVPLSGSGELRTKARQWRRLCRDVAEPAVIDRAQAGDGHVGDGPREFLAIEAAGWKGKARTALASREGDAAFYREVVARFGAAGRLSLYSLEAGGHTLAMQTNLRTERCLFDWKAAYNERFAVYGPGAQLQLRVLELARREGVRLIDTCTDMRNEHQLRLCPGRRRIATLAIRKGGRGPVLALAILAVDMNDRLRGWSPRTMRYRITESGLGKAVRR